MQTSQEVTNIFKAICECKKDFVPLQKNKQGYGYKYVTLDVVIEMLNSVLPKHGLGFVQFPSTKDGEYLLTTRIIHISGEWIEDTISFNLTEISKANDTQKLGASVTYFRRYTLSTIFGISVDEDVDGNIETALELKNNIQTKKRFNEEAKAAYSYSKQNLDTENNLQEQLNTNWIVKRGLYELNFTTNESINKELELLEKETHFGEKILSDKTVAFINEKTDSNGFRTPDDYLTYVKRASERNKKKIEEKIELETKTQQSGEVEF